MTSTEIEIVHTGGSGRVSDFTRAEETDLGNVRVYYDPDDPATAFQPGMLQGPTDEGLFYEEYQNATITGVYPDDNERDGQLIV